MTGHRSLLLALSLFGLSAAASAEDDGEEFLRLMSDHRTQEAAAMYVDAVWKDLDGVLFCMEPGDRAQTAFAAVKAYLEANPGERYRQRRYLIIQGLRDAFPCDRN